MIEEILSYFPANIYSLILVSDPDGLLAEESILSILDERGYSMLNQIEDPLELRHRVDEFGEFTEKTPLIVVTAGDLNQLPYDLWQQGRPVNLALHRFFPNLSYPILKILSSEQRWHLSQVQMPEQVLTRQGTAEFILENVFIVDWDELQQPALLIRWLNQYHASELGQMPPPLVARFLDRLSAYRQYDSWPLAELLGDQGAFSRFVNDQWLTYLRQETGQVLKEGQTDYILSFENDPKLQDSLTRLVRSGALQSRSWPEVEQLPRWAQVAVVAGNEQLASKRASELLALLEEHANELKTARWSRWQKVAHIWAELKNLYYHPEKHLDRNLQTTISDWQTELDASFFEWLESRYLTLSSQRLPPHHVHHVPHFLAFERRQGRGQRLALLILDGMSLADWLFIKGSWLTRHPAWRAEEQSVLAQIPTMTAVSRQALVSGLRPAEFAETINHNQVESELWAAFWTREDMPSGVCSYEPYRPGQDPFPAVISSSRTQALCLVYSGADSLDDLIHHSNLGERHRQSALRLWLKNHGRHLESLIEELLTQGYSVYLASDHGHTEAFGMGQPSEGLTVQSRGKRARYYRLRNAATTVQEKFPDTILWENDPLLPPGQCVLFPKNEAGRHLAFTLKDDDVVAHGGVSLDEVVVPLVSIRLAEKQ